MGNGTGHATPFAAKGAKKSELELAIHLHRRFRGMANVTTCADSSLPGQSELLTEIGVREQFVESLRKMSRVLGAMEKAAAELLERLRKTAVVRHDNRDAAGEGFEDEDSFGFFVGSGNGENVNRLQERELPLAVHFADVGE